MIPAGEPADRKDAAVPNLPDLLTADDVRRAVIDDCCQLIEDEVRAKRGMSGMALKAGFKAFKKVKPGALPMAVDGLLDDFAAAVDPFFQDHLDSGNDSAVQSFRPRAREIADALLTITDRKAERFERGLVRKTYYKLRPTAVDHTTEAVPGVARLVDKYAR